MCRVSVACCCHSRSSDGGALVGLVAVGLLVVALPAIVAALLELVTAILILVGVAVGIVVVGAIVKGLVEHLLDERSLRRHNERMMTQQRMQVIRLRGPAQPAIQPVQRTAAHDPPVRVYATPRKELHRR